MIQNMYALFDPVQSISLVSVKATVIILKWRGNVNKGDISETLTGLFKADDCRNHDILTTKLAANECYSLSLTFVLSFLPEKKSERRK